MSDLEGKNIVRWECELPDGAIENGAIAVFQYLTSDGELHYAVVHRGEVPLSSYVGLLELGKLRLIEDSLNWDEDS